MNEHGLSGVLKGFLLMVGFLSLGVGLIGIMLPLLPTTPLLLLATACLIRSSPRSHRWLLHNPISGKYLRDYSEGKGISRNTKIATVALLWSSIILSGLMIEDLFIALLLIIVALVVSVHISQIPTLKEMTH
jgi:hypothetical protein